MIIFDEVSKDFKRVEVEGDIVEYKQIHDAIGNIVDYVELPRGLNAFVDDEGILNQRPITLALKREGEPLDRITERDILLFGTVVICSSDEDGNSRVVSDEDLEFLKSRVVGVGVVNGDLITVMQFKDSDFEFSPSDEDLE